MLERTLLVVLAMLWLPAGLRAEEPGILTVGSRVRVTSQFDLTAAAYLAWLLKTGRIRATA